MKKILSISFGILAAVVLTVSCNQKVDPQTPSNTPGDPSAKMVTISASISESLTKVTFDAEYDASSKPVKIAHTWEDGDKLKVIDESNVSNYKIYDLVDGAGTASAIFNGEEISAASYTLEAIPAGTFDTDNEQTQASDGATSHLQFVASATGVTDLSANVTLSEVSKIIGFIAKLPAGAAATVNALEIETSDDDFATSTTLKVNITTPGDADTDEILKVYANVPASWGIPAGSKMFLRFKTNDASHLVYTRYQEFASAASLVDGKFNYIKVNCSTIDQYAGKDDAGTSAKPYLIADPYQMVAVGNLMAAGETKYFKLLCDIDLDGISWTPLNPDPFTKVINLDGNNKTISNLGASLFADLNGTVENLTIEDATVSGTSTTGILTNKISTAASTVTNVDINSSSISSTSYAGGLIGEIDIDNTTVTDCDVTGTDVSGTLAGGVIGFANALVTMSGCNYSGGTVTASSRYCGGMLASTSNHNSVITDCHVQNATITNTATADVRTGGFVGQLHTKVTVKGCSVGTSSQRVTVNLAAPAASGSKLNAGGFAGTSYGTVTKNGDVRSKAYVTITCANPEANASFQLDLGGFTGYHQGTIEYTDADVVMSGIYGMYVGGFCGLQNGGTIRYCTVTGSVSGNQGTGGFLGYANTAGSTITECSSTAVVTKSGSTGGEFGSFAGLIDCATITKCYATTNISANANYVGGFIGGVSPSSGKTATIQRCWSTGNMASSSAQCGGFIGHIAANAAGTVNVYDCYSTGNITKGNQRKGGFIGQINSGIVTIARCYATGTLTAGSFAQGGLVGFMNSTATIEDCAAWNSTITAGSFGSGNWSSGAVIGVAWPIATLTNNFRSPDLSVLAFWGNVTGYTKLLAADYDHPDASSSSPLIVVDKTDGTTLRATTATSAASGQDNYPQFAYHGKHVASGTSLSTLASTAKASGGLGWDSSIWDFTGDLPTLK